MFQVFRKRWIILDVIWVKRTPLWERFTASHRSMYKFIRLLRKYIQSSLSRIAILAKKAIRVSVYL